MVLVIRCEKNQVNYYSAWFCMSCFDKFIISLALELYKNEYEDSKNTLNYLMFRVLKYNVIKIMQNHILDDFCVPYDDIEHFFYLH